MLTRTRILAAVLSLALAAPALATTTWTWPRSRAAVATCTTGTEAAPSGTAEGVYLDDLAGFTVHVEAGGAMTAGGQLLAYMRNPISGNWNRVPDLDLSVQALNSQAFAGFSVVAGPGRVAYVPSGVGVAVTIYIVGSYPFH